MSRIGNKAVPVPTGVTANVEGQTVKVKGPKGALQVIVHDDVSVVMDKSSITLEPRGDSKRARSMWGTSRTLVANVMSGVTKGFEEKLEITGVGYRAAVQGKTLGAGHELFLDADIRVAASDTVFAQAEVTRGHFPAGGATIRFVHEAGWANAMRYMLTGDEWSAEEAYRLGLVQYVTPPGQQLARAIEVARKIAAAAPLGVRATLGSARRALTDGEKVAYAALLPELGRLAQSDDHKEYFRALQEKRAPVFHGR